MCQGLSLKPIVSPQRSELCEPWKDRFLRRVERLRPRASRCALYSSAVGGAVATASVRWPDHWWRIVRAPLLAIEMFSSAIEEGYRRFASLGSDVTVAALIEAAAQATRTEAELIPLTRAWEEWGSRSPSTA